VEQRERAPGRQPGRGSAHASESTRGGGGGGTATATRPRQAFGMPNLRRNVCPHFFISGSRGALPIQAPHLLKALIRQSTTVSRCQLRGGVHLSEDYVNDICMSARFNQCVFYEEELTRRT